MWWLLRPRSIAFDNCNPTRSYATRMLKAVTAVVVSSIGQHLWYLLELLKIRVSFKKSTDSEVKEHRTLVRLDVPSTI
jgi:hypothetical protein